MLMQPPPAVASRETETSIPDLSCNKRACGEDAGGDLGRAGDDRQSSRLEVVAGEGRTEELVRPDVSTGIASGSAAAAEAGLTRAREAILTEVVVPPPTVGEAVSEEVVAADASSNPPGQEDTRAVAVKATGETLARVEASDPSEPAALSMRTVMSTFGTGIGAAAGPLIFGAASGSDKAPQGPLTARAAGSDMTKLLRLPTPQPRALQGRRSVLPRPGLALGV
jgi:hypothetical protein